VSRYTNTIQLDWMLASYGQAAERAMQSGQAAELLEEACLGWERAVFDLESARRYPSLTRMSADSANLSALLAQFPQIVNRHPRPAGCDSSSPASSIAPISADAPAAPAEPASQSSPAPAEAAASTAAASSPMPAALERQLLGRLRAALGMGADSTSRAEGLAEQAVDLAVLSTLAESEVPAIRLRARYHLLGQCVLAVEEADRSWQSPSATASDPDAAAASATGCVGRGPREPLRAVQKRLLRSMFLSWRGRHPEPFSEFAVALAHFAGRDNPPLDGPRIVR